MASDVGYADDDGEAAGVENDPGYAGAADPQLPSRQTLEFRPGRDDPGDYTTLEGRPGAAGPVGALLQPAVADALAAPPGALSRDDLIGRTAGVLHQALADPGVSSDRFGDLVGRSVDVLSGLPDDEAGIREALGRFASPAPGSAGDGAGSPPIDAALAGEDGEDGDPDGQAPEPASGSGAAPGPGPAGTGVAGTGAAASRGADFGELSRLEESGSRLGDPGAVSNGEGDPGGVSYGSYQLSVAKGGPQSFLQHEGRPWAARFQGLQAGTPAYSRVWKQIAAADRDRFGAAQKAFADRTYFQPQAQIIRQATGVDIGQRSSALQNAVFSTAVQHGPHTDLVAAAIGRVGPQARAQGGDAALIDAIYAERGRRGPGGVLVHFRSSSPSVQQGVARRLQRERGLALQMLQPPPG